MIRAKAIQSKPASIGIPSTVPTSGSTVLKKASLNASGKSRTSSSAPTEPRNNTLRTMGTRGSLNRCPISLNVFPACKKISRRLGCARFFVVCCRVDCCIIERLFSFIYPSTPNFLISIIRIKKTGSCERQYGFTAPEPAVNQPPPINGVRMLV
jgi:hypothetical protein